jgi:hypothetical protein
VENFIKFSQQNNWDMISDVPKLSESSSTLIVTHSIIQQVTSECHKSSALGQAGTGLSPILPLPNYGMLDNLLKILHSQILHLYHRAIPLPYCMSGSVKTGSMQLAVNTGSDNQFKQVIIIPSQKLQGRLLFLKI